MSIQVIGVGAGRTGTLSLKAALEELGYYKCYHMVELLQHPEHIQNWEQISEGKLVNCETLFAGYEAIVDFPGNCYYPYLLQVYPHAKLILTVRDPESWYDSTYNTVYKVKPTPLQQLTMALQLPFSPRARQIVRIFQLADRVWKEGFQGKFEDRAFATELYRQGVEQVKQAFPPEKLLVFQVQEGWEPLCRFLDRPIPAGKPFPHLNERASFGEFSQKLVEGKPVL